VLALMMPVRHRFGGVYPYRYDSTIEVPAAVRAQADGLFDSSLSGGFRFMLKVTFLESKN
jgi:hypothetical protein